MMKRGAALLYLACLATAAAEAPAQTAETATMNWAQGEGSWQQAGGQTAGQDEDLWTKQNFCDARAVRGSAPLTVLFGISTFWDEVKHRRASLVQAGEASAATQKPLEVHVLGAAYPFEGRSDWSLLASRRPPDVAKVRVVLVLGTPWHMDNVPVMTAAKEFDERRSFLMQLGARVHKPETGKVSDRGIECKTSGSLANGDQSFLKSELCRDHGNGLEVVCIEKYYQDVSDELPKPDVVAMFSPGFPQIARRSWDQVLRKLVATEVPIMVSDLLLSESVKKVFHQGKKDKAPGDKWGVKRTSYEDGMTLRTMRAYGARRLGAFRNPFPIFIEREFGDVTAKNAVLQVFRGRLNSVKPLEMPSEKSVQSRIKLVSALDLKHVMEDEENGAEIQRSMLIPTTRAYDKAMWQNYHHMIGDWVQEEIKHRQKHGKKLDKGWLSMVEKMGLTGKERRKPWNLKEWIFVLTQLKGANEVF